MKKVKVNQFAQCPESLCAFSTSQAVPFLTSHKLSTDPVRPAQGRKNVQNLLSKAQQVRSLVAHACHSNMREAEMAEC